MGAWGLSQIVFDVFMLLGLILVAVRAAKAGREDPRITRGLQVLQGKISVLEDLSDRTEVQVRELNSLLDQKAKDVQTRVELAENQIAKIRQAMQDSMEVAKIFQDKIPHQEIIDRKTSLKYIKAARLAHQGLSTGEIAQQIDIPLGEVEFITKVNRDGLIFDEAQLPAWAKHEIEEAPTASVETVSQEKNIPVNEVHERGFKTYSIDGVVETPPSNIQQQSDPKKQSQWIEDLSRMQFELKSLDLELSKYKAESVLQTEIPLQSNTSSETTREVRRTVSQPAAKKIQKVEFPRIDGRSSTRY